MRPEALAQLCCPHCCEDLRLRGSVAVPDRIRFGVVECQGCGARYPVIEGVLLMGAEHERIAVWAETTEAIVSRGPTIGGLCELVEAGEHLEAFAHLLSPDGVRPDLLFHHRRHRRLVLSRLQLIVNRLSRDRFIGAARRRLARLLVRDMGTMTATEAIDLFYGRFSRVEMANYFKFRFGQPRHLVALGLASVIKERPGVLLDFACGAGHLTHYLRIPDRQVFGIDRNYFRLFLAANFIAPGADFVCRGADRPLPFRSGSLAGAFCSDAFHLIPDKAGVMRELWRVLSEHGAVALAQFGNSEMAPREGYELSSEGYARLCSAFSHMIFGQDDLVAAYLRKEGPDLDRTGPPPDLHGQKFLSMLLAKDPAVLRGRLRYDTWPHAMGQLSLNPIYRVEGIDQDHLRLRFEFPSAHYAKEDAEYRQYAPDRQQVPLELLQSLEAGDDAAEELLRCLVLVGLPERYTRAAVPAAGRRSAGLRKDAG